MALNGFPWNQATLGGCDQLNTSLVTLLAFSPNRSAKPIGTAFIIGAYGHCAVAMTAAHNFKGIHDAQVPVKRHHPSALPEFLPNSRPLDLDPRMVRAICFERGEIDVSTIGWAVYDPSTDIAVFSIHQQDVSAKPFFSGAYLLDDHIPEIGQEVAVLGYARLAVPHEDGDSAGNQEFALQRQLILRCGTVTAIHPEGHLLCRGPCIETSIPVFPGMSGGPVMKFGAAGHQMMPFALVSSDPQADDLTRNDRSVPGSSIMALIKPTLRFDAEGLRRVALELSAAHHVERNS